MMVVDLVTVEEVRLVVVVDLALVLVVLVVDCFLVTFFVLVVLAAANLSPSTV